MSKVDLNALVTGFRGKLGNAVLRRRGSQTYITQKPNRSAPLSEKQKAHTERFRRAAAYAKSRLEDPTLRAEYAALAKDKEATSAFNMAVRDYLKMPEIESVKTTGYSGNVNDSIIIKVKDDSKVIGVSVAILAANATVIEQGEAVYDALALEWKFTATQANATVAGSTVKVTAIDRPGNEITQAIVLE